MLNDAGIGVGQDREQLRQHCLQLALDFHRAHPNGGLPIGAGYLGQMQVVPTSEAVIQTARKFVDFITGVVELPPTKASPE